VVIGKDTRCLVYDRVGADVGLHGRRHGRVLLGVPTPAVAMLTARCGPTWVMILGLAQPYADNGIKFFDPDGTSCPTRPRPRIEGAVEAPTSELLAQTDRIGRATRIDSAQERYIEVAQQHPAAQHPPQ